MPELLGSKNGISDALDAANLELEEMTGKKAAESQVYLTVSDPVEKDASGNPVRMIRGAETKLGDFCADVLRKGTGTNAFLEGEVVNTVDLGTHTLFVCKISDMEVLSEDPSATYTYYHASIKPQPQKKEPEKTDKVVWVCKICGYEYEGDPPPGGFYLSHL